MSKQGGDYKQSKEDKTTVLMNFIKLLNDPDKLKQITQILQTNLETGLNCNNNYKNDEKGSEKNENPQKNGKTKRKLKNLTMEEENKYLENLKTILAECNTNEFLQKMLSKLKLKDFTCEILENEDNEEKWKCVMSVTSNSSLEGIGYSQNKKKAKKLASEQMILCLLNSLSYGPKVKKFIDNFLISLREEEEVEVEKIEEKIEEQINKKGEKVSIVNSSSSDSKTDDSKQRSINSSKLHLSIENLPKLKKKEETIDMKIKYDLNEITIINFEIFCFKWERYTILENEIVYLAKLFNSIKEKLLFIENVKIHQVGSISNMTIRKNFPQVDIIVEHPKDTDIIELSGKCFDLLWTIEDLKNDDFGISVVKLRNNIYESSKESYLLIYNKAKSLMFNIYFQSENGAKSILEHKKWIGEIKAELSIEDLILIKLLKTWRRCKNLSFLKTEIIEIFVYKTVGKESMCEKILRIFDNILSGYLENETLYVKEYQLKLTDNITVEEMSILKDKVSTGINSIKEGKFVELFS